jgi:hypothetical protein
MEDNKITLETVQNFFETNKDNAEVKEFANSFITGESVEVFLNSEEGRKMLQPKMDKHFSKGLETWKQNNLQGLIDEKVKELNPTETEEQKQLRALEDKLTAMEQEKNLASMKANATRELGSKGLPVGMADLLVADSQEVTRDRINMFEAEFKNAVKEEVAKRLKETGGTPNNSNNADNKNKGMTKDKLLKMNYNERLAFYSENKELFNSIMNG